MKLPKTDPPHWAERFLKWYCRPELVEEILGDLYELFDLNAQKHGYPKAKRQFVWNVLRSFRLSTIKNIKPNLLTLLIHNAMLRNYIKISFRQFAKNKTYLLLNSLGLGIAIACCLAAYLFYAHNIEFDHIHHPEKVANIFKVHAQQESKTGHFSETMSVSSPLAPASALDIAGINRFTRFIAKDGSIQNGETSFNESIHFADSTFFDLFEYPLVTGSYQAFKSKHSIFLSQKLAAKLYGEVDPVGADITIHFPNEKSLLLTIGGVVKQMPRNNTFVYNALVRFDHFAPIHDLQPDDWSDWRNPATFFELSAAEIAPEVSEQLVKYIPVQNEAYTSTTIKDYRLEPFLSKFNESDVSAWVRLRMSIVPLVIFGVMAFMILLIACFNLTNTSIAMSSKRLKEIGVRKAIGATRQQIINQFLTETTLTMFVALIVGLVIAKGYLLPAFTAMFKFEYGLGDLNGANLLLTLLIVVFIASLLAGIYPALFNGRMNPVNLVKGHVKLKGTNWFTRGLVTVQFALSVIFLIGAAVFYQNIAFMENINFGYANEGLLAIEISSEKEFTILKNEIAKNPKIKSFAGTGTHISHSTYRTPVKVNDTDYQTNVMNIGKNYLQTIGLNMIQGQVSDLGSQANPKGNILVNQAFIEKTGITDPFNQQIEVYNERRQIVGIVANHKERADRANLDEPFIFDLVNPEEYTMLVMETDPIELVSTYHYMKKAWHKHIPNKPFNGHYQEDLLLENLRYGNTTMGKVFYFLTLLGTLLSLAGIYAMASLNIAKRTKEIGIRKVLGASIKNIINLINKEFVIILSIAAIVGAVGGYALINLMISELYDHHVPVGVLTIVLSALFVFIIGFMTTGATIFKVAVDNPVKTLKVE